MLPTVSTSSPTVSCRAAPVATSITCAHNWTRSENDALLCADAQTSGGLVVGIDPDRVDEVVATLETNGHAVAVIGATAAGSGGIRLT